MTPAERVRTLVDAFNDGRIEHVLDGFTDTVEIAIPVYRVGETAGPPVLRGKEDLRRLLLLRLETGSRILILSLSEDETGALVTINSSDQGQLAVTLQFNGGGLAHRLTVFKQ